MVLACYRLMVILSGTYRGVNDLLHKVPTLRFPHFKLFQFACTNMQHVIVNKSQ